jgi:hypothetical protein
MPSGFRGFSFDGLTTPTMRNKGYRGEEHARACGLVQDLLSVATLCLRPPPRASSNPELPASALESTPARTLRARIKTTYTGLLKNGRSFAQSVADKPDMLLSEDN